MKENSFESAAIAAGTGAVIVEGASEQGVVYPLIQELAQSMNGEISFADAELEAVGLNVGALVHAAAPVALTIGAAAALWTGLKRLFDAKE